MLTNFISKDYRGRKVRIDPTNQYPNLTDICNTSGKNVADFLRLQGTTEYINALSRAMGIPIEKLLVVGKSNLGTWGHPQLAIKCAGWCSPELEVVMTSWIYELLTTGRVEIEPIYEPEALSFGEDSDRVENMAVSAASRRGRRLDENEESQDKIDFPEWFSVTEMLKMFGEDNPLLKDLEFRYGINRQLADLYRARNGYEPPQVSRGRSKCYCYPPSYRGLVGNYIDHWKETRSQLPPAA